MDALKRHRAPSESAIDRLEEVTKRPLSEVDAQELAVTLETEKKAAAPVEVDVRDAKRRITAAKGPKKKTAKQAESEDDEESQE